MAYPPSPLPKLARQLAEQEAVIDGQDLVRPQHLLIALASRDLEPGPTALGTFGLTNDRLRIAVHELSKYPGERPIGRLGFSVLAERAMYHAELYANQQGQQVGHRHLVAGVLSVDSPQVTRVLNKLGTSGSAIQQVLGLGPVPQPSPSAGFAPVANGSVANGSVANGSVANGSVTNGSVTNGSVASRVDDLTARVDQLAALVENLLLARRGPRAQ